MVSGFGAHKKSHHERIIHFLSTTALSGVFVLSAGVYEPVVAEDGLPIPLFPTAGGCSAPKEQFNGTFQFSTQADCNATGAGLSVLEVLSEGTDGTHGGNAGSAGWDHPSDGDSGYSPFATRIDNAFAATQTDPHSTAFSMDSQGGRGGHGGDGSIYRDGRNGGAGGDGGQITFVNTKTGSVAVNGIETAAVYLSSEGGQGGDGGDGHGAMDGGNGGIGGNGGSIQAFNRSSITTMGKFGYGVFAKSEGGYGGGGGSGGEIFGKGGSGGDAGNSGSTISVQNSGGALIRTTGDSADAVLMRSVGGNGGEGGITTGVLLALGGTGGRGGDAETVTFQNNGNIQTGGNHAKGVSALSIGGGGGTGGAAFDYSLFAGVSVGGQAGGGGDAGTVNLSNSGNIWTGGTYAVGMFGHSIGGGGGDGGAAGGVTVGYRASLQVSVGGGGGSGGHGNTVSLTNNGLIFTGSTGSRTPTDALNSTIPGDHATGMLAHSIGGGGGSGGGALAVTGAAGGTAVDLGVALGGKAGNGGDGGEVDVTTGASSSIYTTGRFADGIKAASIGGGGGSGGHAISVGAAAAARPITASFDMGGKGGLGGTGGTVQVKHQGEIFTVSSKSHGISAHSIGGGGGSGGNVVNVDTDIGKNALTLSANLGGAGGIGNSAGDVIVDTKTGSSITTRGHQSHGISAHSIGGGGGNGGSVNAYAISAIAGNGHADSATVNIGGNGGITSSGGEVSVTHSGDIETTGDMSHGVLAQSIGGSGGSGGHVMALSIAASLNSKKGNSNSKGGRNISIAASVGGNGGIGSSGGRVDYTHAAGATVLTTGMNATGIRLQSIGGSGGSGGNAHSFAVSTSVPTSAGTLPSSLVEKFVRWAKSYDKRESGRKNGFQSSISVGGKGGTGGHGSEVTFTMQDGSQVATAGHNSYGIHAQSIGGGGGAGGNTLSNGFAGFDSYNLQIAVGGSGGSAGDGGTVNINGQTGTASLPDGRILTSGHNAYGVFAQSIGGGGGDGGMAAASLRSVPVLSGQGANISVGGSSGAGGAGGSVNVTNSMEISTSGDNAIGIFAQSVGGGGGTGGAATSGNLAKLALGGYGAHGNIGGNVVVKQQGAIETRGSGSHGIFAQSVGGGGGYGGLAHGGLNDCLPHSSTCVSDINYGLSLQVGGSGGVGGHGGDVNVVAGGNILTTGNVSHGIFAQSVGGGGGVGQATHGTVVGGSFTIDSSGTYSSGSGGVVVVSDIEAEQAANIVTMGDGSSGIVAQVISGGGGTLITDQKLSEININHTKSTPTETQAYASEVHVGLKGLISTYGAAAHGIHTLNHFNSVMVYGTDGNKILQDFNADTGDDNIEIDLAQTGVIQTLGKKSNGIFVQTKDANDRATELDLKGTIRVFGEGSWAAAVENGTGTPVSDNGTISSQLLLSPGALLWSGSNAAGALSFTQEYGGIDVEVRGTINANGNTAIWSNNGGEVNVKQGGVIAGDIIGPSSRTLQVDNAGTITGGLTSVGDYAIHDNGRHFLRIDKAGRLSDQIDAWTLTVDKPSIVPQLKSLAGRFTGDSTIISLVTGNSDPVTVGAGDPLPFGLTTGTLSTTYDYDFYGNRAVVTGAATDFTSAGLGSAYAPLASFSNKHVLAMQSGTEGDYPELEALLLTAANATTQKELQEVFDVLDATKHFKSAESSISSSSSQMSNMQSCGSAMGPYAAIAEHDCNWSKVAAATTERNWNSRLNSVAFAFGRQQHVWSDVLLGLSAAYEQTSYSGETSSSDGHRFHLGAIGKYSKGPLYGSLAVTANYGFQDATRQISTSGLALTAGSDQSGFTIASRIRGAYLFEGGMLDLMPIVEADFALHHDFGYTETGAGSLNLKVSEESHFYADLHPAVRISADKEFEGGAIRGYVEAGARFALNDSQMTVSLPNSASPDSTMRLDIDRDPVVASLATGASYFWGDKVEARFRYEAGIGDDTLSHAASLKIGVKF